MSNNIKVNVDIVTNAKAADADVKKVKASMDALAVSASKVRMSGAVAAAREGVAATNAARSPVAKSTYRSAATAEGPTSSDTNLNRGISGQTGAQGRDFAKQAQGLGGLVHVYATFAANLFAVSAAFGALSRAADTTNMIKGLDQLGAASGRNLASLAKGLTIATGGAISLRDAMTATAQATSAGMSGENLNRMAIVAKNASQALGVAMPDALSRLSRGITKLEPELLDELGIFVRVDKSVQDYARSVSKSANALTDFERRHAFALAAIEQGEKKFGAIKLDANPYDKILASMQNLAQSGGELLNKVLGPLLTALSSSPVALGAVMAGIAGMLLSKAIPALSQWREGLHASAAAALKASKDSQAYFEEFKTLKSLDAGDLLKKQASGYTLAAANMLRDNDKLFSSRSNIYKQITSGAALTTKDAASSQSALTKVTGEIARQEAALASLNGPKQQAAAQAKIVALKAEQAERIKLNDLIKQSISLTKQGEASHEKAQTQADAKPGFFKRNLGLDEESSRARVVSRNEQRYSRSAVLSNVGSNTQNMGAMGALSALWSDVFAKTSKDTVDLQGNLVSGRKELGAFSKASTLASGALRIVGSTVMTLVSSLQSVLMIAGALTTVFSLLNGWFSTNSKETEELSSAMDTLKGSAENVQRTLDAIYSGSAANWLTTESITARATAFMEVSSAIENMANKLKKAQQSASTWDKGLDYIYKLFGGGLLKNSAKATAEGIAEAFKAATPGKATTAALKEVQKLLGVSGTDSAAVYAKLSSSQEFFDSVSGKLSGTLKTLALEMSNVASRSAELDASFKEAGKSFDAIVTSLQPTDNIAKLGYQMIEIGDKMATAIKDPTVALAQLKSIANDSSKLKLIDPDTAKDLIGSRKAINDNVETINVYTAALEKLNAEEAKLQSELKYSKNRGTEKKDKAELARLAESRKILEGQKAIAETNLKPILEKLDSASFGAFKKGAELVYASIEKGFTKAQLIIDKAKASLLEGTATGIIENSRIDIANVQLQMEQLNVSRTLIHATNRLADIEEERLIIDSGTANKVALDRKEITPAVFASRQQDLLERSAALINVMNGAFKQISTKGKLSALSVDPSSGASEQDKQNARINRLTAKTVLSRDQVDKGIDAQIAVLDAEKFNIKLKEAVQLEALKDAVLKKTLETSGKLLSNELSRADVSAKSGAYVNNYSLEAQKSLEIQIKANKEAQEDLSILRQIENVKKHITDADTRNSAVAELEAQRSEITKQRLIDAASLEFKYDQSRKQSANDKFTYEMGLAQKQFDATNAQRNTLISLEEMAFERAKQVGLLDQDQIITKQASLETTKEQARAEAEAFASKVAYEKEFQSINSKIASTDIGNTKQISDLMAERDALFQNYNIKIAGEGAVTAAKLLGIEASKQQSLLLNSQAEEMAKMVSLTDSLAGAFGSVGEAVGGLGQVLTKMAQDDLAFIEKRKLAQEKADEVAKDPNSDAKDRRAANNTLVKLDKDKAKSEIDNLGKIAGASKKMFAEKTFAHKALAAVEKAASVMKVALWVKEMFFDTAKTGVAVANSGTRIAATGAEATTSGVAAIINAAKDLPTPLNFIAGAAMAAFVASILGGGDKSVSVPAFSPNSEQRQETQGTGTSWDANGNKYENGGGVFGDAEAKSKGIADSLEIIKRTSVDGLGYDNKMLNALERIASALGAAAVKLYGVQGLRTGLNFGTMPGQTAGGTGGLLGSIFGGKTTSNTSITSAGLKLTGTFDAVSKNVEGSILQFKDILTNYTKSGGWFSRDKAWSVVGTEIAKFQDAGVAESISDAYRSAGDLFTVIGEKAGVSQAAIDSVLKSYDVTISADVMGLKGQELLDELNGVVSSHISGASSIIFKAFEPYKKFDEDFLTTVVRVVDANDKINSALKSIGSTLNLARSFQLSEWLVELSGGLEEYLGRVASFGQSFLTKDELLVPKAEALQMELSRLGYASVDTREEFKALIQGFNVFDKSSAQTYSDLLKLSDAFNEVHPQIREVLDLEGKRKALINLQIEILKLEGKMTESVNLQRQELLATMDESLITDQKYIWQLQDEAALRVQSIKLLEAEGSGYEAVLANRQEELRSLTDALKPGQLRIWQLQDEATTKGLLLRIYDLEGNATKTIAANREKELSALSGSNQELLKHIHNLQDDAKLRKQGLDILTAQNDLEGAKNLQRQMELQALEDMMRPGAVYLEALRDEKTIKDKLTQSINNNVTSLKANIISLSEYSKTLKVGALSTATPSEKYAQNKAEVNRLSILATAVATTSEEVAARNDAISKLTTASDTFLNSSREMYASSEQYTTDYSYILDIIDGTSNLLTSQQTTAEKQLDILNTSSNILQSIDDSTKSTSELMVEFLAAQAATNAAKLGAGDAITAASSVTIPAFAEGGVASGISLVGEKGPEIVNFSNPARVYSNKASNDLFNNGEIIAELRSLRAEVSRLREEQREQTGHIISTNYDANTKAATRIATATENATSTSLWSNRSEVRLA